MGISTSCCYATVICKTSFSALIFSRLGSLVGYKVGLDKEHFSPDTLLLYCTTGVLKKMIIGKRCLTDWTHVILDEVHDREEDMDFLMLLAKKFVNTNSRGVKLILMSATLDITKLVK